MWKRYLYTRVIDLDLNYIGKIYTKKKQQIKKNNLLKRLKTTFKSGFIVSIIILTAIEMYMWYLESNGYLVEPYEYGTRLDISFKINECYELFNKQENQEKLRIVIIGDSRAETGVDPKLLDFYFNKKTISYNLAIFDSAVRFHYFLVEKVIVPKLHPDIIIWEPTVPQDWTDDDKDADQRKLATPMARYYTENTDYLDFEEFCKYYLFKYSRLYRYRSNLKLNIYGLNKNEKDKIENYEEWFDRGYFKNDEIMIPENQNFTLIDIKFELDDKAEDMFFDAIDFIKENTKFYLIVNGPNRFTKFNSSILEEIFSKISNKRFLDLDGNSDFLSDFLWMNPTHLNENGALLFTFYIYKKINNSFKIV